MRDRYEIKTEIDEAQQNLEQNLGELKDVLMEKVDIKAKVDAEIDKRKDQAAEAVARGQEIAVDLYDQARMFVRDKPLYAAGIVAGVLLVGGAVLAIRHQLNDSAD
ncbi:MAG: hypothetical protein JWP01_1982 [Myxococcales bacterium]|nr:hypothetical protein [Myxococcales bacterium]